MTCQFDFATHHVDLKDVSAIVQIDCIFVYLHIYTLYIGKHYIWMNHMLLLSFAKHDSTEFEDYINVYLWLAQKFIDRKMIELFKFLRRT